MSNDTKRVILCLLFGAALIGSLATSFVHVAEFFAPITPPWFPRGQYIAALSLDVLAAGCGFGMIVMPHGWQRGRWWLAAGLLMTIALSMRANWLYAIATVPDGADITLAVVSAALPVLAYIVPHALAAVLAAVPPDVADTPPPVATPVTHASAPAHVAAPLDVPGWTWEAARDHVASTGQVPAPWDTRAELAAHFGKHPSRLSEATARARRSGSGGGE